MDVIQADNHVAASQDRLPEIPVTDQHQAGDSMPFIKQEVNQQFVTKPLGVDVDDDDDEPTSMDGDADDSMAEDEDELDLNMVHGLLRQWRKLQSGWHDASRGCPGAPRNPRR
ncbi:hypothetical protein Agub_g13205 [Astrephomene gubernaculifera]|uniref:Uncharacterized protein n=1 Tax=Astrephomene gubernaculifera TaxID=47775 RepID=A0AAD3E1T1_9CHLO|nr:hypothetical protein Agub_g13205 [Astrephomene gubernaculifera]